MPFPPPAWCTRVPRLPVIPSQVQKVQVAVRILLPAPICRAVAPIRSGVRRRRLVHVHHLREVRVGDVGDVVRVDVGAQAGAHPGVGRPGAGRADEGAHVPVTVRQTPVLMHVQAPTMPRTNLAPRGGKHERPAGILLVSIQVRTALRRGHGEMQAVDVEGHGGADGGEGFGAGVGEAPFVERGLLHLVGGGAAAGGDERFVGVVAVAVGEAGGG